MATRIRHITVDCRQPYELARFWRDALGFTDDPDNPNHPGDPEAVIVDPKGLHPGLLFIPVPEHKSTKNRIHLDVVPDGPRDAEVERLIGLGATLVADHRKPDWGWAVLADPEGNEFCVELSMAERGRPAPVDTGEREMVPDRTVGEREMLDAMLEWYRAGVIAKVTDLSERVAHARPLKSSTSIAGLVNHLALVEDSWFTERFQGASDPEPWASVDWDADPDWEFHTAHEHTVAELVAQYAESTDRSRAVAAAHALDDVGVGVDELRGPFTLRFILLHLIEETARHLGHVDVLRELLDGTTGE